MDPLAHRFHWASCLATLAAPPPEKGRFRSRRTASLKTRRIEPSIDRGRDGRSQRERIACVREFVLNRDGTASIETLFLIDFWTRACQRLCPQNQMKNWYQATCVVKLGAAQSV